MLKRSNVILKAAAVLAVCCSPVFGAADNPGGQEMGVQETGRTPEVLMPATHSVLAEYLTATWCGYCKYAHGALMEIDDEAQYDFFYVSHVTDKCTWAAQRKVQFNTYGYPTVYFDGGYKVVVGAGSIPSAKANYISAINLCASRTVPSLTVALQVVWVDDATLGIRLGITNNEASTYEGYLRTFVTETASSLGWNDTYNKPYTYAFLDYSVTEPDLVIEPGETVVFTDTWVGADHHNGQNVYYGSITRDNTTFIAGVYNDEWHQGYSYNNSYPFDAYYVDEAEGVSPLLAGDANGDELVDIDDIFEVLAEWGPCDVSLADVNQDGNVDIDDIFFVLSNWS